jgi:hypothetical protein
MSHAWSDIQDPPGTPQSPPEQVLLAKTLNAVLPPACLRDPNPTDADGRDASTATFPTFLHPNAPNPFNPATSIRFDLARSGRVRLSIRDVGGRVVRLLVDREMPAGSGHEATWDGLDARRQPAASGVYFVRLDADDTQLTRKILMLK